MDSGDFRVFIKCGVCSGGRMVMLKFKFLLFYGNNWANSIVRKVYKER